MFTTPRYQLRNPIIARSASHILAYNNGELFDFSLITHNPQCLISQFILTNPAFFVKKNTTKNFQQLFRWISVTQRFRKKQLQLSPPWPLGAGRRQEPGDSPDQEVPDLRTTSAQTNVTLGRHQCQVRNSGGTSLDVMRPHQVSPLCLESEPILVVTRQLALA